MNWPRYAAVLSTAAVMGGGVGLLVAASAPPEYTPHIPGAVQHRWSQQYLCTHGTRSIRPNTQNLKYDLALQQNVDPHDFELDHLISLSIGGAPRSHKNLWLQPWSQARRDDYGIERKLYRAVCSGSMTQYDAQREELSYKRSHG